MQLRGQWHIDLQREYTPTEAAGWCAETDLTVLKAEAVLREVYPPDPAFLRILVKLDVLVRGTWSDWGWYSYVFAQR